MASIQKHQAVRYCKGNAIERMESLSIEEPLQIRINGKPFSITMRTPGNDRYLVKGLLHAEEIVREGGLKLPVCIEQEEGYTSADVTIPEIFLCENAMERRTLVSQASCGVCGTKDISSLKRSADKLIPETTVSAELVERLESIIQAGQKEFKLTGGCHAASIVNLNGDLLAQFEDIGRHNAVDKCVGYLIEHDLTGAELILHVSGRLSFEIVSKAFSAGIPFLCSVSAPSSLAVEMAQDFGITLMAFCREDRFTVYSHPENISN